MIISHKHKFIFLHNPKTAGSSTEFALSKICGPEDVITEIKNEKYLRQGRGPQNHKIREPGAIDKLLYVTHIDRKRYKSCFLHQHTTAAEAKMLVGSAVWDSYFKFTTERNPWDRIISWFFHRKSTPEGRTLDLETYVKKTIGSIPDPMYIYAIESQVAVDKICKFENLEDDISKTLVKLGMEGKICLPKAKYHMRPDKGKYREYFTGELRDIVGEKYRRVIELLGYEF